MPLGDPAVDAPPVDASPDDRAPETSILAGPDPFSRLGASTFQFASDDPAATFECSVDGDTPIACQAPYTRTLGDGPHTFSVRAIDPTGNRDLTPAERLWTIDTVPPDTAITAAPPPADNSATVRFDFRASEPSSAFECSLDGGPYAACASGAAFGPLDDGAHAFAVRARDRAGNVDSSPAIRAWLVDTSTPDTVLLSGPSGATGATSATFSFVSPDAGAGATFQCALDGAAYAACTSPRELDGLAAGPHTFGVRVRDAVGNFDPTPAIRAWTVDLTPPTTAIVSGPSGLEPVASASFAFTSDDPDAAFTCSLDGAPPAACSSPFTAAGLAQGDHTFAVQAIDVAGHPDPTPATRAWTVDTAPPDVAITSGPAAGSTSGPHVKIAFGSSEAGATLACSLDGTPFAGCASPLSLNLRPGPHELRVRATDAAGNAATEARAWTVTCGAPDVAGAVALLHLDDAGQDLWNAVSGGAAATLGEDATQEPTDPRPAGGRFGGALAFASAAGERVAWPVGLGPTPALAIELWVSPEATAGARDLLISSDGRVALRALASGAASVRISATAVDASSQGFTATSGAVAAGAWHHVLVSLAEPALRLWVDGARVEVGGVALGEAPDLGAVRLGGNYDGLLDEIWIAQAPIADDDAALDRYCPP